MHVFANRKTLALGTQQISALTNDTVAQARYRCAPG